MKKDKKLAHSAFSTASILLVVAILIFINLIVSKMDISIDLTQNSLYSISEETKIMLDSIEQDVYIYALYSDTDTSQAVDITRNILNEYESNSKYINVEYVDPITNPGFVEPYITNDKSIDYGSIIVESGDKFKVISSKDLYKTKRNPQTRKQEITTVYVEPEVTNAIKYVTAGEDLVMYTIVGHNEPPMSNELQKQFTQQGYEIRELELQGLEEIPEDASTLWIQTPERDWTEEEAELVRTYLQNGGSAIFFVDYTNANNPNFLSVLETYGMEYEGGVILESNKNNMYPKEPATLIPNVENHPITETLIASDYQVLMPNSTVISPTGVIKSTEDIQPILTTSKGAYSKVDLQAESINKEPGDITGPFPVAYAITDNYDSTTGEQTRIVVVSSQDMLTPSANRASGGTNYNFIAESVNWLNGNEDYSYINPKSLQKTESLQMTSADAKVIMILEIIIIPISILLLWMVVWYKRRNN